MEATTKFKKGLTAIFMSILASTAFAQNVMDLYPGKIPNAVQAKDYAEQKTVSGNGRIGFSKVFKPELYMFFAEKPNGTAIIICPGGGYSHLAFSHEGIDVAKALNAQGITAFVLKYRLPSDQIMVDKNIGPLQDAQQAIKTVRANAEKWKINPLRIGIMGFSAGGHLASTLSTHFADALIEDSEGISLRPDFSVLGYPVISMGQYTHKGSKTNLLGANASDTLIQKYSNELQINAQTPPAFLFHANDDKTVPVENSVNYMLALKNNGVPAEAHFYPAGGHGFGMNNPTTSEKWFDNMISWLHAIKMLD